MSSAKKAYPYWRPLIESFEAAADPAKAVAMEQYMRNQFAFYGLPSPLRQQLLTPFIKENGLPKCDNVVEIIHNAWQLPQREMQYAAMFVLQKQIKELPETAIELFEQLIVEKSWWDSIDFIAPNLVGTLFLRFPEIRDEMVRKWMLSGNFWLQRSCLIFQLKYKDHTDEALLFELCSQLAGEKEFFIRKAIGWVLRQYARTAPHAVKYFVENTDLQPLSKREALKHF
ncbi:MAG: DNA alkylation repair protein [Bacteroidales bacterium]|nr:DNA alkylation repair protein [Bacteroidales bacterium]